MPLFRPRDRRYRVLYDVHAWIGAIAGLVLYLMFVTGIVALVWHPVGAWEEPAHHVAPVEDVDTWWNELAETEREPTRLTLNLPEPEQGHRAPVGYVSTEQGESTQWVWREDGWGRARSHAGLFLFRVHFLYHSAVPILYTLGGLISLAMLLAILTGLGIHLRKVIPEMNRFRAHLPARGLWSDLHKVSAVAGLPFQLMIAYTAALIVLGPYAIAAVGVPLYGGDLERVQTVALGEQAPKIDAEEELAPQASASAWIAAAKEAIPDMEVVRLRTAKPGLATTVIRVNGRIEDAPGRVTVYVAGTSAEVLAVRDRSADTVPAAAQRWLLSLHFAELGGWGLKLVYALLALLTAITVLTGIGLWLERRAGRVIRRSDRTLARMTAGIGGGLPVAIAFTLLASLVVPADWASRNPTIELAFVLTLAGAVAFGSVQAELRQAWARLLWGGAVAFAILPLVQAMQSGHGLLGASSPMVTAVDIGLLVTGTLLAVLARIVARGPFRAEKPPRRPK
ncbi:MAG: PepSY-associated TM helix domain-containing protein [Myxococcota bacterium]